MNEEQLQQDIRRFLKTFGVAANREIEAIIRRAVETGAIGVEEPVRVRARLELLGSDFVVDEELRLS